MKPLTNESIWLDAWLQNKSGSMWPVFHGSVILPYILKAIWCLNMKPLANESVWLDAWPHNKNGSLWPIFHGSMILPHNLKAIWCINLITGANESVWLDVWPSNKSGSLWPIFHGSVILPYILKTNWCINMISCINESVWLDALPHNKTVSLWPISHGSVILLYIWKAIRCINMIPLANESVWLDVWPPNWSESLWPIFHGSLILAYILKTLWCIRRWHWPGVYVSLCSLALVMERETPTLLVNTYGKVNAALQIILICSHINCCTCFSRMRFSISVHMSIHLFTIYNLCWPWHLSPCKWLILWNHCTHDSQVSHVAWSDYRPAEKIQSGRESQMAASAKNIKTYEINFFSRLAGYVWPKFCMDH